MNDVVALISSVGFPIVACIFMAIFIWKMMQMNREAQTKEADKNIEAITKMSEALQKNTEALGTLVTKIELLLDDQKDRQTGG